MEIRLKFLVFISFFVTFFFSCNNEKRLKTEEFKQVKKDTIYFTVGYPTTTTDITCYDFLESLSYSVKYFSFDDSILKNELLNSIAYSIIETDNKVVDVRYKIVLDTNIICLDRFGYGYYNDKYIGKYKKFDHLKKVIENNRNIYKSYKDLPTPQNGESILLPIARIYNPCL